MKKFHIGKMQKTAFFAGAAVVAASAVGIAGYQITNNLSETNAVTQGLDALEQFKKEHPQQKQAF